MSFTEERQAIEEKIQSLAPIGGAQGVPLSLIGFANAPIDDPAGNRFIKVNFLYGEEQDIEIGTPSLRRYTNVLIFQIFEPQNQGTRGALTIAASLENSFRDLRLTAGAGKIRFYTPTLHEIGDEGNGYYQINVQCPYKLDERK